MVEKTDLKLIQEAGLSTAFDFRKEKINTALTFIFQRFQIPITHSFARVLGNMEKAEERFADFSMYLIENRKQIFRGFNAEKGSLQSYLYKIAHRHLARKKEKQEVALEDLLGTLSSSEFTPDQIYEAECVDILINLAMQTLKLKNAEGYQLLRAKYLSEEKLSSLEIALRFGKLSPTEDDKEQKRAQNLVDKLIGNARKDLREIIERKLQNSLSFLEKNVDIAIELSELKSYIPWISIKDEAM